jgi:hypothetical protein
VEWRTRAAGRTELHVSTWAAYEYAKRQPAGTEVKIYKRGLSGWQLQETVTAGDAPGASTSLTG